MIIALDAMGGDFAPTVTVEGAVQASSSFHDIHILLVGNEKRILDELRGKKYPKDRISLQHADEIVSMDESISSALRKKKSSSIAVAVDLLREEKADAVVSAGHSGVAMALSLLKLGKTPGVERPAIATIMPSLKNPFVLIDAGANVDCESKNLLEFALMGNAYFSAMFDKKIPRVALLSIGEEDVKGNELTKEAFKLLKESSIEFVGNIDGKDVFAGEADVIVCDGFTGNVALKISEGLAESILKMLRTEISGMISGKLGYLFMKPALKNFKKKTDYAEYGGAPLLGINGISIISHGRSSSKAIDNALKVAAKLARKRLHKIIEDEFRTKEEKEKEIVKS